MTLLFLIIVTLVVLLSEKLKGDPLKVPQIYSEFKEAIDTASIMYGITVQRIAAIIAQESSGNADAKGTSGEIGLMQVTPGALSDVNRAYGYSYVMEDLKQPDVNINVGTGYLAYVRNSFFNGDLNLATRAYNVGLRTVQKNPASGQNYLDSVLKYEQQFFNQSV